jgi:hypothetical protein
MISSARLPAVRLFGAAAGLLALSVAVAFLTSLLTRTGGALAPPLDDTLIYLQYARRLAEGHPFSYTEGAAPSTGATSLLHLLLLVPGWWLGFHGSSFIGVALGLGAVYFGTTLFAAALAVRKLAPPNGVATWGAVTVLLVLALRGHLAWGALSGMDTGLWALALAALAALVALRGSGPGPAWWLAGGLGFVRPEGIVVGFVSLALLWLTDRRATDGGVAPEARARARRRLLRMATFVGALALLLVPPGLNVLLTGAPQWDSMTVKGLWSETRPDVLRGLLSRVPAAWLETALLPFDDFRVAPWHPAAGVLLAALLGGGFLVGWPAALLGRFGAAGRLMAVQVPLLIVLGGLSPAWHSHYFRYQIPTVVPVTILAVLGLTLIGSRLPSSVRRPAALLVPVLLCVALLPGFSRMRELYGRNADNIHDQQMRVAAWIEETTAPGTRIALNDAGAIAYFGERPVVDLVGLVDHGWATPGRQGAGALFERLESLPVTERPTLMAIYAKWYPYLVATHFAGEVLFKADLPDNTICGDRLKQVYRIDWSLAGSGTLPVQRLELIRDFGMTIVDSVDVADLASEQAHDYTWTPTYRDRLREFPTAHPEGPVVLDGGRWIAGGESMRIRARPGEWLALVLRTESEREAALDVRVNGRPAGRLEIPRLAAAFTEPILQIPDSLVVDSLLTVEVEWVRDPRGDGYTSYHYWFLQ